MAQKLLNPLDAREDELEPKVTRLEIMSIDKDAAILEVEREDGRQFSVLFLIEDILRLYHNARSTAAEMVTHLCNCPFALRQAAEIIRRGLRANIRRSPVYFDPARDEYRIFLQLEKEAPLPLILTRADADLLRAKLDKPTRLPLP